MKVHSFDAQCTSLSVRFQSRNTKHEKQTHTNTHTHTHTHTCGLWAHMGPFPRRGNTNLAPDAVCGAICTDGHQSQTRDNRAVNVWLSGHKTTPMPEMTQKSSLGRLGADFGRKRTAGGPTNRSITCPGRRPGQFRTGSWFIHLGVRHKTIPPGPTQNSGIARAHPGPPTPRGRPNPGFLAVLAQPVSNPSAG